MSVPKYETSAREEPIENRIVRAGYWTQKKNLVWNIYWDIFKSKWKPSLNKTQLILSLLFLHSVFEGILFPDIIIPILLEEFRPVVCLG